MSSTIVVSVPLGIDLRLSTLHIQNQLGGSGNAGFGVDARGPGNYVSLNDFIPTITGASGNATVDGAILTWSTDFASSGNYAVSAASGSRIYRG